MTTTLTATEDLDPTAVRDGILLGAQIVGLMEDAAAALIRQGRQAEADEMAGPLAEARQLLARAKAELDG